eukprot:TRINITY_DN3366_c3_g1_i1.p1 TRINITY_DN3366_c3_g1~~TRINITY_DN3366_c3_g1_i1.p1  ORF type:complete len:363 (+),score=50.66 TRINITY_DN3366_c3_g1_i1:88-1176(+)
MGTWDDLDESVARSNVAEELERRSARHAEAMDGQIRADPRNRSIVFAKDATKGKEIPGCALPLWFYPTSEKLMYEIERRSAAMLKGGSGEKKKDSPLSQVTSVAVYKMTYKLSMPVDKLTSRDDALYYITGKMGGFKLEDGKIQTTAEHFVRDGNNQLFFQNKRYVSFFTKNYAKNKAVERSQQRVKKPMLEQIKDLKAFPFAPSQHVGCTSAKAVLVSDLKPPSKLFPHYHTEGYFNLLNGFYFHPYHIGSGDHGNTSVVSDLILQTCHLYLRRIKPQVALPFDPRSWTVTGYDSNYTSYVEVAVPFVCCITGHKTIEVPLSTGGVVTGYELSYTVHQDGRDCNDGWFTLSPLPSWATSRL